MSDIPAICKINPFSEYLMPDNSEDTKNCPFCGIELDKTAQFCPYCKKPLVTQKMEYFCEHCKRYEYEKEGKTPSICSICGRKLKILGGRFGGRFADLNKEDDNKKNKPKNIIE